MANEIETWDDPEGPFARATHDLHGCLRAIKIIPDWIQEDMPDEILTAHPELSTHLATMQRQAKRADRILVDMRRYMLLPQKLGAAQPVNISRTLELIWTKLTDEPLECLVQDGLVSVVRAPEILLYDALAALISNAIKHGSSDKPNVTVTVTQTSGFYEICVSDTGPGIQSSYLDKALEPFVTLQPRDQREGSGMGLAIAKRCAELMRGKLHLENTSGDKHLAAYLSIPKR